MNGLKGWALYAVALAVAAALALAAGAAGTPDSPVPSVENTSGAGTRALYLYLLESGLDVAPLQAPLTELPPGVRTVVVSSPSARPVTAVEVQALERFAQAGGTVVVLASTGFARSQTALAEWLELQDAPPSGPGALEDALDSGDAFGLSARVALREGPFAGVGGVRVGRSAGLSVGRRPAVPIASLAGTPVIWWLPLGRGELIVSVPDIAENRRIELEDNLAFWSALASRGPLRFDEFHHTAEDGPPMSRGLVAFSAQLLALFAFFAWARGTRLGPPRPERIERHRSTREYLDAFAWLTRRARVEPELLREAQARFRFLLQERLGVSTDAPDVEVALELERKCQLPREQTVAVLRELIEAGARARGELTPAEYASILGAVARLERVVQGRAR